MAQRTCVTQGCDNKYYAYDFCRVHYRRWRRTGDPQNPGAYIRGNDLDRFWSKVEKTGACWLWRGSMLDSGYGAFYATGKNHRAHRWSYQQFVGPIPDGLTIDHLCRVTRCVNPSHLEAVTMRENTLRGTSPIAVHARKTECWRGHPFTPDNTRRTANGGRECLACKSIRKR